MVHFCPCPPRIENILIRLWWITTSSSLLAVGRQCEHVTTGSIKDEVFLMVSIILIELLLSSTRVMGGSECWLLAKFNDKNNTHHYVTSFRKEGGIQAMHLPHHSVSQKHLLGSLAKCEVKCGVCGMWNSWRSLLMMSSVVHHWGSKLLIWLSIWIWDCHVDCNNTASTPTHHHFNHEVGLLTSPFSFSCKQCLWKILVLEGIMGLKHLLYTCCTNSS